MAGQNDTHRNGLLTALSHADLQRWLPHLEPVDLASGQVLHEQGQPRLYAYFPTSAVVAVTYVLGSGAPTEVALVGAEGFVGSCLLLDGGTATTGSSVLIAGQGFRIKAKAIRAEFERSDAVRRLFLRYILAVGTQMAQTAVCNRHHTIDQQVCGWLLHCLDRVLGSDVAATQETLGLMLGVRRESVTEVAGRLRADGLIRYTRGHIEILDRGAIQRRACECHAVVKREYDRLLQPGGTARLNSSPPRRPSPVARRPASTHASP